MSDQSMDAAPNSGDDGDDPIERGDLDGVLRLLDQLTERRAWDDIEVLRRRCLVAFERGHQLWPAAGAAAHRLALRAPASHAAAVCADPEPPFRVGPLTEVVASTHRWAELDEHLDAGPARWAIAHERVLRGDRIENEAGQPDPVFGLPLELAEWEASYPCAVYDDFGVSAPSPSAPPTTRWDLSRTDAPVRLDTDETSDALMTTVATWVTRSTGRAQVAAVEGTAEHAIVALGLRHVHAAEVSVGVLAQHVAWAAASGGAHGPRRGMAAARLDVWWLLACATNLHRDWPIDPDELSDALRTLRFVWWHPGHQPHGWELHVVIEDRLDGLAWSLGAADAD